MARPPRPNRENGWYHTFSRGVNRQPIFRDERDSTHFLELLEKSVDRFRIVIHAYVLMSNHYHLIVQTPDANLSRAMQWINQSYANWYVARYSRTGQVFQRPFGSRVIEDGSWALELSEYVHLNPLRIAAFGLGKWDRRAASGPLWKEPSREEVTEKLKVLRSFRWSSYRSYAGYEKGQEWLKTKALLKQLPGKNNAERRAAYRKKIRGRLKEGVDKEDMERLHDAICVGSAEFVRHVKDLLSTVGVGREHSGKQSVRARVGIEKVIEAVSEVKGEPWDAFRRRHGDCGKALVMLLARKYSGLRLRDIGDALGGKDYAAVSVMIRRFERRVENDRAARNLLARTERRLNAEM